MKTLSMLFFLFSISVTAQVESYIKMITTEYEFAKNALEVGTRKSFLNFIADDGILFRPGPVNGKEFLEKAKDRNGFLYWYPSRTAISQSGDMGFTSGPWSYKKDKDSAEISFGHFCTIWERQKDGLFKFAIDYGITHPKQEKKETAIVSENNSSPAGIESKLRFPPVMITDIEKGFILAVENLFTDDSQLLTDGNLPFSGKDEIDRYLEREMIRKMSYSREGGKLSSSNDFAFTYGIVNLEKSDSTKKENYYFRVWNMIKNKWSILSETWNPK